MDAVILARLQFAFTISFHFLWPPLTIGMAWVIFYFMTRYLKTGGEHYRSLVRFWLKLFIISFSMGVATGLTMLFQFGTNWSEYSRTVGDIFGAPLAAEAVLAFFLESTFLGVLIFGWKRVSRGALWFSSLMVALGSTLSAFWIIVANSWMQTPAGYEIIDGRAQLVDPIAAIFNPSTLPRYWHTMTASLMTGSFFMLGIAAYYLLKKRHLEFAKESLKVSLIVAFASSVVQLGSGDFHAKQVARTQPEKFAAIEGLFESQTRAPMVLLDIPREEKVLLFPEIKIHGLLSWLAYGDFDAEVKGLKAFPRDEWPPIALTFYPFHFMVIIGLFLIFFSGLGVYLLWKKKLFENALFLKVALFAIPLPQIANQLGWITAEVGRQPWIVYKIQKTADAVSISVPAEHIALSLVMFALIYALLFYAWFYLLKKFVLKGPELAGEA